MHVLFKEFIIILLYTDFYSNNVFARYFRKSQLTNLQKDSGTDFRILRIYLLVDK